MLSSSPIFSYVYLSVAKVRPEGSGLEVEDRMLLTLCDSKEQGLWS